jgi:hypothetical protein
MLMFFSILTLFLVALALGLMAKGEWQRRSGAALCAKSPTPKRRAER